jgi:hypothetical protein
MKQKLTERYVIDLMKEEWDKKVHSLLEKSSEQSKKPETGLKTYVTIDGKQKNILSKGLKVTKKKSVGDPTSGMDYKVVDVSLRDKTITLQRFDQKSFTISLQEFEDNYIRE